MNTRFSWSSRGKASVSPENDLAYGRKTSLLCGSKGSSREKLCQLLQLTLLAILPGIILIIQNALNLAESVQIVRSNQIVKYNIMFSVELGSVIHQIQIERGTTALFVSSNGDQLIKPRLLALYVETDKAIAALSKWIPIDGSDVFKTRKSFQGDINRFRTNLTTNNITLRGVIDFYSEKNAKFISMIGKSINMEKPFDFWTDLTAYQMLIFSKEQAGIERALGSTYFARANFDLKTFSNESPILLWMLPLQDLLWYEEKKELGQHFLKQSMEYSKFTRSLIRSMYMSTLLANDLDTMREMIMNNSASSPSVVSGTIWFDNMTEYINILKYVQDKMAERIIQRANEENSDLKEEMTLRAFELAVAVILIPIVVILVSNIIKRIHRFSSDLQIKTSELEDERKRTEELLYQLLPRTIARKLVQEGNAIPEAYHSATILFSDVVGFTEISSLSTPMQVISMLNKLYLTIDGRLENFDVYKVETIGDGYMVASGIPCRNGEKHVEEIAKLSIDLLNCISNMEIPHLSPKKLQLRIGFNTGPCVAGVVGIRMPRYCIFGDTVNTASRMESTALPLSIQMSEVSACMLQRRPGFIITERGTVEVKGKGLMCTYWLEGYERKTSATHSEVEHPILIDDTAIDLEEKPSHNLGFADDMDGFTDEKEELTTFEKTIDKASSKLDMESYAEKTTLMTNTKIYRKRNEGSKAEVQSTAAVMARFKPISPKTEIPQSNMKSI